MFRAGIGTVAAALLSTEPALADPFDDMWKGHGPGMMGWDGWFIGPVMMLFALAAVVGIVILMVRVLRRDTRTADQTADRSLAILRERFAQGEIDADEFEARRKILAK